MRKRTRSPQKASLIGLAVIALSTLLGKIASDATDGIGSNLVANAGLGSPPPPPQKPPRSRQLQALPPEREFRVDLTPDGRPGPGILAALAAEGNATVPSVPSLLGLAVAGLDGALAVNAQLAAWGRGAHHETVRPTPSPDGNGGRLVASAGSRWAEEFRSETGTLVLVVIAKSALEAVERATDYFEARAVEKFLAAWERGCVGPMSAEVRQVRVQLGTDVESAMSSYVQTRSSDSLDHLFGAVSVVVESYRDTALENHQANGT